MIRNSLEKTVVSVRSLRDAPGTTDSRVDITLFANYYGTVNNTQRFNDPSLYTDKHWYVRFIEEIKEMRMFRRKYKHV